jgi:hypothetical protein
MTVSTIVRAAAGGAFALLFCVAAGTSNAAIKTQSSNTSRATRS